MIFLKRKKEIEYTEKKRHEKNVRNFLNFVQIEGEATADLPLSFLGNKVNDPFKVFFRKLCRIMGIADLLLDAVGYNAPNCATHFAPYSASHFAPNCATFHNE